MVDLKKYRPEVDGLRAVAVLLVLLFHADLGFSGGFVGVDVFFVISGFLITGLILKKQSENRFQLSQFWIRRIRRILPASIVMTAVTLVMGFFILMPSDYQKLGDSAIAQQLMVSNFYFWQNTGYFDAPANFQPFMHTWSLAVEEQFYLIYPFLLYGIGRFRARVQLAVLLPLFLASFIASEWAVQKAPSAAYFLLPFRAWEMILGGLICYLPMPNVRFEKFNGALSFLSLTAIVACGWFYHESYPFPGIVAALPVFAAALFIYANSGNLTRSGRVLAAKPFVFVGMISYSLYLIHWPILAFVRMEYGNTLSPTAGVTSLVASLALAYVSWRFVEQPVRKQVVFKSTRAMIVSACCVSAMLMIGAFSIYHTQGFPNRLSKQSHVYLEAKEAGVKNPYIIFSKPQMVQQRKIHHYGDPNGQREILVWGDSHAMAAMPGIDSVCRDAGIKCYQIAHPGNPPVFSLVSPSKNLGAGSVPLNDAVREFIKEEKIGEVVMVAWWTSYFNAHPQDFEQALTKTIDEIQQAGATVTIVEDVAEFEFNPPSRLARSVWKNERVDKIGISLDEHYLKNHSCRKIFATLKKRGVRVYDPALFFLDDSATFRVAIDGECMFKDRHHLSMVGAKRLQPMFETLLKNSSVRIAQEAQKILH